MKKSELQVGVQFKSKSKYSDKVYKLCSSILIPSDLYVTSKLVTQSGYEIEDNQYSVKEITDEYLILWTFAVTEYVEFKVSLSEIEIIKTK